MRLPRRSQDAPRGSQEGQNSMSQGQRGPRWSPRPPKRLPRGPQEAQDGSKRVPRGSQWESQGGHKQAQGARDTPEINPEASGGLPSLPRAPQRPPRGPQEAPKTPHRRSKKHSPVSRASARARARPPPAARRRLLRDFARYALATLWPWSCDALVTLWRRSRAPALLWRCSGDGIFYHPMGVARRENSRIPDFAIYHSLSIAPALLFAPLTRFEKSLKPDED